jgi:hypothetical protein
MNNNVITINAASIAGTLNAYKFIIGKRKGKSQLEIPRHRRKNSKLGHVQLRCEDVEWFTCSRIANCSWPL